MTTPFRNIAAVWSLGETPAAYLVSLELYLDGAWRPSETAVRPGGGGVCDAVLAAIAAGDFAGAITPYAPPPPAPPDSLPRAAFWLQALAMGATRADAHATIDALLAADQLTPDHAARLRIKVDDAARYDRLDPDLLTMAQAMGLATDQAALDAAFLAAVSG